MNPYKKLVNDISELLSEGKQFPLGGFEMPEWRDVSPEAPVAIIFSPHPDDECIIGGLPLRLHRENGYRVINVAVTQGSNPERQIPRLEELKPACRYLNFELLQVSETGFARIKPTTRESDPDYWDNAVKAIRKILEENTPEIILFPHETDQNSGHVGVNMLIHDALEACGESFSTRICETEFWSPMRDPNLLLELSNEEVGDMLTALSFHIGEVSRNPYHLRTPMWMVDNVRRGGEIVGKQGGTPPDFQFGTIYRTSKWSNGAKTRFPESGQFIAASDNIATSLKLK